jgi:hypothetical protein
MHVTTVSILIGSFILISTVPEAVAQVASDSHVQVVAAGDSNADREGYAQNARNEMQVWRGKLDQFDERAKARGQQVGSAAENELNVAWTQTAAGAKKLQSIGADGWEEAKISYEKASSHLADTWDRIQPKEK